MTIFRGLMVGDTLLWHSEGLATRGDLYSDNARMMFAGAEGATALEVAQARKDRWKLRRAFIAALEGVDVMIVPGAPLLAPLLSEVEEGLITSGDRKVGGEVILDYAIPFNITGLPALVMPVALSPEEKVPVPIMIAAKPFREDLVLQAAAAVSAARPFNTRPLCFR
jgi:amidase